MTKIDVFTIGASSYDLYFSVDKHPGADVKTVATSFLSGGGGPAANAAVSASRLGSRSAFAGYLGNDVYGDLHYNELRNEKVITDFIFRGDTPTPISTIIVKPDGKRSLINHRTKPKIDLSNFQFPPTPPRVILFDGHEVELSIKFLKYASEYSIPTILDAGSMHEGTLALYEKVDYLISSEKFAKQITCESSASKVLSLLKKKNPNTVITLGKKGVIWDTNIGKGKLKAHKVDVIDTTGAGDSFHGAFAVALANNLDFEDAILFANKVAALTCIKLGARNALPTIEGVKNFRF